MTTQEFIPQGLRCIACTKLYDNCSGLDFRAMRPIAKPKPQDELVEVLCTHFSHNKDAKP